MGWITSWANKREDYFSYFGKGARISRNWVTAHFLAFSGQPWNCHGTCHVSSVQSCPTLCDPVNCSTPGLPVHHQLLESTQTHVHWVGDAIQPFYPLSFPSPPALNLSQHQGLFQWVSSLHEVAKVLEFQLQHRSPLGWTGWISLQSKGLSRVFSNTTVQNHQFFDAQLSL